MTQQSHAIAQTFLPVSETLQENAARFWENQERILECMNTFGKRWLERRHAGTRAASEAAQRMCEAQTPIDLVREYQDWVTGAAQRLMADGLACQQQFLTIVGAFAAPMNPSNAKHESAAAQSEVKVPTRSKAA
jgi:hypothetical protein